MKTQKDRNPLPQVWQAGQGGLRDLTTALLKLNPYPRIYVAPDGRVVQVGDEQVTRFLDTSGTGKWTTGPSRKFGVRLAGTSAMYADGKVLTVGGGKYNVVPTKTAEVLDLDAPAPAWRYTAPMAYARKHANATVLPDGKVLVTGGSGSAAFNDGAGAVLAAEMWDPATGAWTTMASMRVKRVYHSTAILLPDGRVLSAGGTAGTNGVVNNRDAEIYSPPYLFNGPRPTITSAPASVGYGQTFAVQTPDAAGIAKVTLVRLSSVTHSFNHEPAHRGPGLQPGDGRPGRDRAVEPEPAAARALHAVHPQRGRRAVGRDHRSGRLTPSSKRGGVSPDRARTATAAARAALTQTPPCPARTLCGRRRPPPLLAGSPVASRAHP